VFTNNPCHDKEMLLRTFLTLSKRHAALNKLSEEMNEKTSETNNTTATGRDTTMNGAAAVADVLTDNEADTREILQFSCRTTRECERT
jgi:hypothetical protein